MRCTYRNTQMLSDIQSNSSGSFGTYAFQRGNFSDLGSHCFYNFPTSTHRPQTYCHEGTKRHPGIMDHKFIKGHVMSNGTLLINDSGSNYPHNFLRIISTVTQTECCGGQ